MSKGLVPFKPIPAKDALPRAVTVTGLWQLGREAKAEDVRAQHAVAKAAVESGETAALIQAITERPTAAEFGKIIDELIGSFAPRQGQNMVTFGKMLTMDVAGLGASRVALEAAAKALRAGNTFLPAIEEVLEAVKWQRQVIDARVHLLERLPARVALAEKLISPDAK